MTCDFISLLLQAIGGALASTANTQDQLNRGTNIMIAGLSFQVASLLLFMLLCADFALRVHRGVLNTHYSTLRDRSFFHLFLYALATATFCIFVRSVFRVAELSKGFHGPLDNSEVTYMILEGVMIIITVIVLTVCHPGIAFQGQWRDISLQGKKHEHEMDYKHSSPSSLEGGDKRAHVIVTEA